MTTPAKPSPAPRRLTVEISAELYSALIVAKTHYRKSLTELTREGLEIVARQYRARRLAERNTTSIDTPSPTSSKET